MIFHKNEGNKLIVMSDEGEFNFSIKLFGSEDDEEVLKDYQISIGKIEDTLDNLGDIEDIDINHVGGLKQFYVQVGNYNINASPSMISTNFNGSKDEILSVSDSVGDLMKAYLDHSSGELEFNGQVTVSKNVEFPGFFDNFESDLDFVRDFKAVGFQIDIDGKQVPVTVNSAEGDELQLVIGYGIKSVYNDVDEDSTEIVDIVERILKALRNIESKVSKNE